MDALQKALKNVSKELKKTYKEDEFMQEIHDLTKLEFLSTGHPGINIACSNRPDGGFPVGLITELAGENATGKSLLAMHALVETQKKGGVAVLIDCEGAYTPSWYKAIGGDPETLIKRMPEHINQAYDEIKAMTEAIRADDTEIPITFVYDSTAASQSKSEFEGAEHDMAKRAQGHGKGLRMLMGLCKRHNITFIAINQLRATFNMYGPEVDTIGGKAWKYAPSLRITLKKGKHIEIPSPLGGKKRVGIHGKLTVTKSRLRDPWAEALFDIYYKNGIDPLSGMFDVLVDQGVILPRTKDDGTITKGWWDYKGEFFQKSRFDEILAKYPELLGGHEAIEVPTNTTVVDEDGKSVQRDTVSSKVEGDEDDDDPTIEIVDGDEVMEALA